MRVGFIVMAAMLAIMALIAALFPLNKRPENNPLFAELTSGCKFITTDDLHTGSEEFLERVAGNVNNMSVHRLISLRNMDCFAFFDRTATEDELKALSLGTRSLSLR